MLPKITNNTLAVNTEYSFQLKTIKPAIDARKQHGLTIGQGHGKGKEQHPESHHHEDHAITATDTIHTHDSRPANMPIIPPRLTQSLHDLTQQDDKPSWYAVISPRETRGLAGPFSILQLKQMYRVGTVSDKTLVWRDGEEDWQQLINQSLLRSQLINLPILPPRIGKYNAELAVYDPVLELPSLSIRDEQSKHFKELETTRNCFYCGGMAIYHLPPGAGDVEQPPDLYKTRDEVGTTEHASEILPGFLWVGCSKASKHRSILTLGLTLLINVSPEECKTPHEQLPYFRCKEFTLKSGEELAAKYPHHHHNHSHGHGHSSNNNHGHSPAHKHGHGQPHKDNKTHSSSPTTEEGEINLLLQSFETLYDWIEWERKHSDRNKLSDKPPKPYRGPVDEFGFPIKTADDKPFRRPNLEETDGTPCFPPRVLIYSKNGHDRSCAVGLSYVIKNYGLTLQRAMEIVLLNRPTMKLSPLYMQALKRWSLFYSTGIFLCIDCKENGKRQSDHLVKFDENDKKKSKKEQKKKIKSKRNGESNDNEIDYYDDDGFSSDSENEGEGEGKGDAENEEGIEGVPGDDEGSRMYRSILALFKVQVPRLLATIQATAQANAAAAQGHVVKHNLAYTPNQSQGQSTVLPPISQNGSVKTSHHSEREKEKDHELNTTSMASISTGASGLKEKSTSTPTAATTAGAETASNAQSYSDLSALYDVRNFFTLVPRTYFEDGCWTKLLDIDLSDRLLSDLSLSFMFQLLTGLGVMKNIRMLSLRNNQCSSLAYKALLVGLFPKDAADPDEDDYLEDKYAIDMEKDYPELMCLDISHNKLDEHGTRYMCFLLQQCNSLMKLNMFNTKIEDEFLADIIGSFSTPLVAFEAASRYQNASSSYNQYNRGYQDDDDDVSITRQEGVKVLSVPHNHSVTELDLGRNHFGPLASKALSEMLKRNVVISHLKLDLSTGWTPPQLKKLCNAIRLYNSCLQNVSCSGMDFTVKSVEYIGKIHDSKYTRITHFHLHHAHLKVLHIQSLVKHLPYSQCLMYLDISGNPLGNRGGLLIAEIVCPSNSTNNSATAGPPSSSMPLGMGMGMGNSVGLGGHPNSPPAKGPPLTHLDVSACQIQAEGTAAIMKAVCQRPSIKYFDISNNIIGCDNQEFFNAFMKATSLDEVHLAYCQLQTTGACAIFHMLIPTVPPPPYGTNLSEDYVEPPKHLGWNVRSINLAGNEVSNACAMPLVKLLQENIHLEVIDLGFNLITNDVRPILQQGIKVESNSTMERKVNELHVNLLGNPCDPYVLEFPGMARAKVHFRQGLEANKSDSALQGYSHLEHRAKGKFFVQKELYDQYRIHYPPKSINTIR